jgi:hypothetical protein
VLATSERVEQILGELEESGAETLVLLGDQPIRWFLREFAAALGRASKDWAEIHRRWIAVRAMRNE